MNIRFELFPEYDPVDPKDPDDPDDIPYPIPIDIFLYKPELIAIPAIIRIPPEILKKRKPEEMKIDNVIFTTQIIMPGTSKDEIYKLATSKMQVC